jgi:parallel beta-helix repeat protein
VDGWLMKGKLLFLVCASIILLFVLFEGCSVRSVRATRTWIVDKDYRGDFNDIQDAINAANPGDIIEVSSGIFYEHLVVNKSVALIGENSSASLIDGNRTGTVVTVKADSVWISGFTIQKSGEYLRGIFLDGSTNSTIQDNIIVDNYHGVWLNNSEKTLISDNLIQNNMWGIYSQDSRYNLVEHNMFSDNYRRSIHLDFSDNNTVAENNVTTSLEAIYLEYSSNNSLRNNNLTDNMYDFGVLGKEFPHYIQDIDSSNIVDGKPIIYWVNQHDRQVPTDVSYVAVVNSTGITVENLNLSHHQEGLLFAYTTNSTIENVYISNARCGFRLISCASLRVSGNTLEGNAKGIRLDYSVNMTINSNIIMDNHEGIFLDHSSNNIFSGNMVADNIRGIFVYYATDNIIYHNNFVKNEKQVFIAPAKILLSNSWDLNNEGNYWSDHIGAEYDKDGVSTVPYVLDGNNQDNSPLSGLFSNFIVILNKTSHYIAAICNSTISDFEFDFSDEVISFDVFGANGTVGFCRVTIPHRLLNGSYEVFVDGLPPLTLKELASSNSTHTVLYFTYAHSTHNVLIVPEQLSMLLLLSVICALTILVVRQLEGSKNNREKSIL